MGALASAWQLVRLDPDRYEVTVYQRGWRLGGKGASGRNLEPGKGLRVEEHGLHILMGFYNNVFHVLKSCYDDLDGFGRWEDALSPSDIVHICDRYRNGDSAFWEMHLPAYPAEAPGARPPSAEPDVADWLRQGFAFLVEVFRNDAEDPGRPSAALAFARSESSRVLVWLARAMAGQRLRHGLVGDALVGAASPQHPGRAGGPVQAHGRSERRESADHGAPAPGDGRVLRCRELAGHPPAPAVDQAGLHARPRPCWMRWTTAPGCTARVRRHRRALARAGLDSPLVNDIYNLIFSRRAGFGAGAALYDTLSMLLTIKGTSTTGMNGGMGDVVFRAPYLWLRQRGVRFRFFHRVRALRVDPRARPSARWARS
jgi:hypothetical protein